MSEQEISHKPTSPVGEIFSRASAGPICVVDGMGISLRVNRGHLIVSDGIGKHRRERRYHRATHGLSRIVILGSTGTLSLDALRYCDRLGISVVVIDPATPRPSWLSLPRGTDDARLLRIQARAPEGVLGIDIARVLIGGKLDGQAQVLRSILGVDSPASTISNLRRELDGCESVEEVRQLEATAAACYFNAWMGSSATIPRFATRDQSRVPDHWLRFEGRRSRLGAVKSNKRAERPLNAILGYLFALLEVESVVACHRVGMDPGLGIVHLDTKDRDSLALDLMEPVRPAAEAWALELFSRRSFRRSDFSESPDGHVRVLAPLTHELADTMGHWRKLLGPWVELVAHMLGRTMTGKYDAATPLTKSNSLRASKATRNRRRYVDGSLAKRATNRNPRQAAIEPSVKLPTCVDCGGKLARGRHQRCPACWANVPGQDEATRTRRGDAISESKRLQDQWRAEHRGQVGDPEEFRATVLPKLAGIKLSEIVTACGVSKSTASNIRAGKLIPHVRHWASLAELGK